MVANALDDLLASNDLCQWALVRDLIRSGQVPFDRVAEIVATFPQFAAWLREQQLEAAEFEVADDPSHAARDDRKPKPVKRPAALARA